MTESIMHLQSPRLHWHQETFAEIEEEGCMAHSPNPHEPTRSESNPHDPESIDRTTPDRRGTTARTTKKLIHLLRLTPHCPYSPLRVLYERTKRASPLRPPPLIARRSPQCAHRPGRATIAIAASAPLACRSPQRSHGPGWATIATAAHQQPASSITHRVALSLVSSRRLEYLSLIHIPSPRDS